MKNFILIIISLLVLSVHGENKSGYSENTEATTVMKGEYNENSKSFVTVKMFNEMEREILSL